MSHARTQAGFALFAALWMAAILAMLSLTTLTNYVGNTQATQVDLQRIQATQLLDSGVRFAALSLAAERPGVIANAVPAATLVYRGKPANVRIKIQNEAAFIDLNTADTKLLNRLLEQLTASTGASGPATSSLLQRLQDFSNSDSPQSYRLLRETFADVPGLYQRLIEKISLHNRHAGVHPLVAGNDVLELLPDLSVAQRRKLLENRQSHIPATFSSLIKSDYFSSVLSPCYRITTITNIDGRRHVRLQVIRMLNRRGQLFELVATL